jgi:UDP-N-acetylglucosamine acyltransferase
MPKIHPTAIVEPSAIIGEDVEIGPYCIVGPDVSIGARTRMRSHVVVEGWTQIGEDNDIYPNAYLGGPPQHAGYKGERTQLIVGDRNLIREQVTMHCGTPFGRGVTTVGSDCLFFLGAHVAHDCIVEDHVILVNNATLGGHVRIGEYAIMGGLSAAHQYTRIGRHSNIGGLAAVTKDIIPFGSAWGNHAHLEGLNLVGLKRRGFARPTIQTMLSAFSVLFAEQGITTFQERIAEVSEAYTEAPEVMEIIDFIRADAGRPLCLPQRDV